MQNIENEFNLEHLMRRNTCDLENEIANVDKLTELLGGDVDQDIDIDTLVCTKSDAARRIFREVTCLTQLANGDIARHPNGKMAEIILKINGANFAVFNWVHERTLNRTGQPILAAWDHSQGSLGHTLELQHILFALRANTAKRNQASVEVRMLLKVLDDTNSVTHLLHGAVSELMFNGHTGK